GGGARLELAAAGGTAREPFEGGLADRARAGPLFALARPLADPGARRLGGTGPPCRLRGLARPSHQALRAIRQRVPRVLRRQASVLVDRPSADGGRDPDRALRFLSPRRPRDRRQAADRRGRDTAGRGGVAGDAPDGPGRPSARRRPARRRALARLRRQRPDRAAAARVRRARWGPCRPVGLRGLDFDGGRERPGPPLAELGLLQPAAEAGGRRVRLDLRLQWPSFSEE